MINYIFSLALQKCKKDCNILEIILVQGVECPVKIIIIQFPGEFLSKPSRKPQNTKTSLSSLVSDSSQLPNSRQQQRGGVLSSNRLLGMCYWVGSHFHGWIDYYRVAFSLELLEWDRTFSRFGGSENLGR